MQRFFRSAVIFLILAALCAAYFPLTIFATPETHPNTHVNTGDQRFDIIAVAKTQVGYLEGANNDTKYGVWYGYNHIAWCGTFVAWCANQAGVPTSVLAKTGVANPQAYGLTPEPLGYVPQSGDLFFAFDNSHVGFVYYVEGDYFYSLEGNTRENGPDGVYIRRHKLTDVRFASPKYQGGGSHNYVLSCETAHPHREYYKCSDCGDQYYTGKTTVLSDCRTCIQSSCSHSFSTYSKSSESQHSRSCSRCGKIESANHVWNAGSTIQSATCNAAGSTLQTCLECAAQRTVILPATGNHTFTSWEKQDESSHVRTCSACGKKEVLPHDVQEKWQTDEQGHWYDCTTCGVQIGQEAHSFGEECDAPCTICEYIREDGHRYGERMLFDGTSHWLVCGVCGLVEGKAEHEFTSECDDTCDPCGFERTTQHRFSAEFSTDASSHWYACSVCDEKKDLEAHIPETVQRQGAIQHCTVCRQVLTAESMHTHGYDIVDFDREQHWGSCSCGLELEPQLHQWSVRTEVCTICAQPMPARNADDSGWIPWAAGSAAILVVGGLLLILLLRKKK